MNPTTMAIVAAVTRAVMVSLGTYFGVEGLKDNATIEGVVGAILTLGAVVWSINHKIKVTNNNEQSKPTQAPGGPQSIAGQ